MSNIYALEPHTNAKVILHTTSGDIEVELWGKEAPRATRNFIQLCLEGYYDNTIFHRVVPGFLVQGGDPTGTGHGGESIYDDGFPDEFHSRLRFNRRGLVGVANTGQNDNGSQFFITLDRADELTKRHTLFGRVAGDTLFNVMKMTELELDENERPLYPPRIRSAEVILNPFDDIIPRITAEEKKKQRQLEKKKRQEEKEAQEKKKKKGQKKQLNLLSFGEEAKELEPASEMNKKIKSVYDLMPDAQNQTPTETFNNNEEMTIEAEPIIQKNERRETENEIDNDLKTKVKDDKKKKKKTVVDDINRKGDGASESAAETIEKLKHEIRNISKVHDEEAKREEQERLAADTKKKGKKISLVALEREKYVTNKSKKSKWKASKEDDEDVLGKLTAFRKKISSAITVDDEEEEARKKQQKVCDLHGIPNCESCFDPSKLAEDDVTDEGWLSHKLVFDKDLKGKDLMQRKENVDDYVVIDPRDREAKAKQEEYEKRKGFKTGALLSSSMSSRKEKGDYHSDQRRKRDGHADPYEQPNTRRYESDDRDSKRSRYDRRYNNDSRR